MSPPKKLENAIEYNVTSFASNAEEYIKLVGVIASTASLDKKKETMHRGELFILPKKARTDDARAKMIFSVTLWSADHIAGYDENVVVDRKDRKLLTLKFLKQDLYLIAYSLDGKEWFVFEDHVNLLKGSTKLEYGSSYGDLVEAGSKPRNEVILGKYELVRAFENLFHCRKNPNKLDKKMEANSLMTLIVMTSEASRFECLKDFVVENFYNGKKIRLEDSEMVNKWEKASNEVISGVQLNVNPHVQRAKQYVHVLLNPEFE